MRAGPVRHARTPSLLPPGRLNKSQKRKLRQTVDNSSTPANQWQNGCMPRFLTLADVAEQLQINSPAAYALVRSGELKAIQVGGRGQWRVEEKMLEQYIEERYAEASRIIQENKSKSV
jgi:excisionase family DNA binding protein